MIGGTEITFCERSVDFLKQVAVDLGVWPHAWAMAPECGDFLTAEPSARARGFAKAMTSD